MHTKLKVYVLGTTEFLMLMRLGIKLTCQSCEEWLKIGDILVSKMRAHSKTVRRDLDCAIEKYVLTTNVIDIEYDESDEDE